MGNAPEFGVDIRRQVSTTRIPAVSRAELGRPAFLPWDQRHENPAASPPAAGSAPRAFCPGPVSAALFSPVRESHDPDAHPSRSSGKLSCAQTQLQQAVPHIPVLSALPPAPFLFLILTSQSWAQGWPGGRAVWAGPRRLGEQRWLQGLYLVQLF